MFTYTASEAWGQMICHPFQPQLWVWAIAAVTCDIGIRVFAFHSPSSELCMFVTSSLKLLLTVMDRKLFVTDRQADSYEKTRCLCFNFHSDIDFSLRHQHTCELKVFHSVVVIGTPVVGALIMIEWAYPSPFAAYNLPWFEIGSFGWKFFSRWSDWRVEPMTSALKSRSDF